MAMAFNAATTLVANSALDQISNTKLTGVGKPNLKDGEPAHKVPQLVYLMTLISLLLSFCLFIGSIAHGEESSRQTPVWQLYWTAHDMMEGYDHPLHWRQQIPQIITAYDTKGERKMQVALAISVPSRGT